MIENDTASAQAAGGHARAEALSPDARKEIAKRAAEARWNKKPLAVIENNKPPKALYLGVLPIGDMELECAVLDNGMRVLTAKSVFMAFGRARKGMNSRLEMEGTKLPPFLAAKNL